MSNTPDQTPTAQAAGSGTPPSEMFEDAFMSPCSGIRRSCECGREFYDLSEGDSTNWERGEWADLTARDDGDRVIGFPHSVGVYVISDREYVVGCPCNAGGPAERWILENADNIARYLNERAKALRAKADRIEVQNTKASDGREGSDAD